MFSFHVFTFYFMGKEFKTINREDKIFPFVNPKTKWSPLGNTDTASPLLVQVTSSVMTASPAWSGVPSVISDTDQPSPETSLLRNF